MNRSILNEAMRCRFKKPIAMFQTGLEKVCRTGQCPMRYVENGKPFHN